jgi:hypothetical protein
MIKFFVSLSLVVAMCPIATAHESTKIQCLLQNNAVKEKAVDAGIYNGALDPVFEIRNKEVKQITGLFKDDPFFVERFDDQAILLRQPGISLGQESDKILREFRMIFINRITGDMNEVYQYIDSSGKNITGEELDRLAELSGRNKTIFTQVKKRIDRYKCSRVEQKF